MKGKWSLTNWFNLDNHMTFPVIAHHCFSKAIVSAPKYLAKWEAGKVGERSEV